MSSTSPRLPINAAVVALSQASWHTLVNLTTTFALPLRDSRDGKTQRYAVPYLCRLHLLDKVWSTFHLGVTCFEFSVSYPSPKDFHASIILCTFYNWDVSGHATDRLQKKPDGLTLTLSPTRYETSFMTT